MRKNKKLFAILTLVAFMMTLMPVLAFGAAPTTGTLAKPSIDSFDADGKAVFKGADYIFAVDGTAGSKAINGAALTGKKTSAAIAKGESYIGSSVSETDDATIATASESLIYTTTDADVTGSKAAIFKADANDTTKAGNFKTAYDAEPVSSLATDYTRALAVLYVATPNYANAVALISAYDDHPASDKSDVYDAAKITVEGDLSLDEAKIKIAFGTALTDGQNVNTVASTAISGGNNTVTYKSATGLQVTNLGLAQAQASAQSGALTFELKNTATGLTKTITIPATIVAATAATLDDAVAALSGATITVAAGATTATVPANVQTAGRTFQLVDVAAGLTNKVTSVAAASATTIGNFDTTATAGSGTATIEIVDGSPLAAGSKRVTVNLVFAGVSGGSTTTTGVSVDASIIATKDANASVEAAGSVRQESNKTLTYVDDNRNRVALPDTKYAEIELVLRQANNASFNGSANVYVWAEESGKSRQATDALVIDKGSVASSDYNVYLIPVNSLETIQAAFLRAGTYTIKASIENPTTGSGAGAGLLASNTSTFKTVANKNTITATALAQKTREFTVDVATGKNGDYKISSGLGDGEKTTDEHSATVNNTVENDEGYVSVAADTVATTKVSLTVRNNAGNLMTTYPLRLSTNSANIELDETNVTTDYKGVAEFNVAGIREGEYKIYVTIGDYEATIMVNVGATTANNIELIKFPSNPIATDTLVADYKDIFRFQLTDANGNIVKNNYNGSSYANMSASTSEKSSAEQAKYAYIVSAPEANKVKNADLILWYPGNDKDYYTLNIKNNKAFEAEGDYEIRVVLNNGKSATLNFSVKKFDKAVSLHIEYPTTAVELNSVTEIPDIYFLDANRVMKKANNRVTVAAQGYAVASVEASGDKAGQLTIKNDEKYVGQTITVTAASDKENLMASTTLTVADEAREVKLDTNRGPVNANNRVGFKVVDSTGNPVALGTEATVEVTAVVTNTGDPDAKVSYSVTSSSKRDLMEKGTGVINLSANKQTTATVQIMVKVEKPVTNAGDNNTGLSTTYYTGTETFTFGAEADKSVVMTIGSKEIVAQNVPVTIDVAPFIQDNRTYVPFRALVEAFGAEVDYNADNNTVTTKLDGKTVVLTVGSTVLTVNDETVTMDVAPFIVDDRVVVPVRFVGEAFGFTVEATQDADTGATASVVFYQK